LNNPLSNRNKELEKKSYVNTLKELNPIKMEILFPIKNPIDVSNGIKKMLMEFNEKAKSNEVKTNLKLTRQNNQLSQYQDFTYPFKQDFLTCNIL
jgi:hypothetical protein